MSSAESRAAKTVLPTVVNERVTWAIPITMSERIVICMEDITLAYLYNQKK